MSLLHEVAAQASAGLRLPSHEVVLQDGDLLPAVAPAQPPGAPGVGPSLPPYGGEASEALPCDVLALHRTSASGMEDAV